MGGADVGGCRCGKAWVDMWSEGSGGMTLCYGAAVVCGVAAVEVDADDLRDAGLLHGDPIDDVGLGHGAFAMGDHHELCGCAHLMDELGEAAYVGFVERSVDFVEDAEWCGLELKDPYYNREAGEGFFSSVEHDD